MQFFIDSQGTVANLISSPVYQGSTNACELVLVAPFSASNVVEADFRLPTGINTVPYLMTVQGQMVIEKTTYNVWRVLLDGVITEYAGKVTVQFKIYQSGYVGGTGYNPITPTTYASTFSVVKGVVPTLPDEPSSNIYESILSYLSQLDPQYNIKSVNYSAPDYEIDTDIAINAIFTTPETATLKNVDFSINNIDGSQNQNDGWFFALGANYQENTGFNMDFENPTPVGKMQITFGGIWNSVLLEVQAVLEDDSTEVITDFRINSVEDLNVLVNINKTVKSISIIQPYQENYDYDANLGQFENYGYTNGRYFVRSIKMWSQNTDGQITVTSSSGRTIAVFPDADYASYLAQVEETANDARESAQSASESAANAQEALDQILSKSGQVGGYPVLENIGGKPKIPSVYINLVDSTVFTTITSESELETLVAPVGAIARLVVDIDDVVINGQVVENLGDKVVTKSFVKLQEGTGTNKWALFATSYADNASNALHAEQATNALRINNLLINGVLSEADYGALPSKQGVYFVSIEGENDAN